MPDRTARPVHRPDDDPWAVAERKSRAIEEPLDVVVLAQGPFPLLEVRNPLHGTAYRVTVPAWPDRSVALCTCTDFARRGLGTCKHIEAATRWLERHPSALAAAPTVPVDGAAVWAEIDRRLAGLGMATGPASLVWREPGAALYATATPYRPEVEKEGTEEVGRGRARRSTPSSSRGRP